MDNHSENHDEAGSLSQIAMNNCGYVRDVSMAEDASRVRKKPGILARIRSFATNILRANGARNIRDTRYRLALGGLNAIFSCHAGER